MPQSSEVEVFLVLVRLGKVKISHTDFGQFHASKPAFKAKLYSDQVAKSKNISNNHSMLR